MRVVRRHSPRIVRVPVSARSRQSHTETGFVQFTGSVVHVYVRHRTYGPCRDLYSSVFSLLLQEAGLGRPPGARMPLYNSKTNTLLAALPEADFKRVNARLDLVQLELGTVVSENGSYSKYAYFPIDCILSLLYVMENGDSAEIAMVGNEGVVGIAEVTGGESMLSRVVVQSAGAAYRIAIEALKNEFTRGGVMQSLLLRFTQAMVTQMAQTAACNRHHSIEQQLCRWLLLSLDRLPTSEIV